MKDQQKKMFYIKKQLTCNSIPEIIDGIDKARQFLSQVNIPQLLNNVVLQLLDLFISTKLCYIKNLIADTISISFPPLITLSSHPSIVTKLTQSLTSNDQILRILSLQMITHLRVLFAKDSSVYHQLLSKISKLSKDYQQANKKEMVKTIICLRTLLQNSQYLASIFSNNIKELKELGGIHIKFILYFCIHANFEARSYENIIRSIWQILETEKRLKTKANRKYFLRLLKKGCQKSYKCTILYSNSLKQYFPELENQIKKVQNLSFSFLEPLIDYSDVNSFSHQQLLDFCYQQTSIFCQLPPQIQPMIQSKIMEDISFGKVNKNTLLLTFYLTQHNATFEQSLCQNYIAEERTVKENYNFLKIALVCAKYALAQKIIYHLMNTTGSQNDSHKISALLISLAYTQLHLKSDMASFFSFIAVLTNLAIGGHHYNLYTLAKLWRAQYEDNFKNEQGIEDQQLQQYCSNSQVIQNNQQRTVIKCISQLRQIQSMFAEGRRPLCQESKKFSKIYFSKQAIIDIYKYI